MLKILLLKGDKNDATIYYVDIVKEAFVLNGCNVAFIEQISQIYNGDDVFVITLRAFWKVWRTKRARNIICWFQGVVPEEVDFYPRSRVKNILSKIRYTILERFVLSKSTFNLFVSNSMANHYNKKYGYKKNNYIVMPCFNQPLLVDAFYDEKYNTPTFVYTGNLAKWQCFEPMVSLFCDIQKKMPNASLTIYSKEKEEAEIILAKYGVKAEIKYVPYQQLSTEIMRFKYGFILREDNIVNNVATPTKMNSYLASGIIPIYTDVVGAYKENLSNLNFAIPLAIDNGGLGKLYALEKTKISGKDVLNDFNGIFKRFYNRDYYIKLIAGAVNKHCKRCDIP